MSPLKICYEDSQSRQNFGLKPFQPFSVGSFPVIGGHFIARSCFAFPVYFLSDDLLN